MFQSLAAHNFHTSVFRGAHSQFMTILGENVPAPQPVVAHNATSLCSRYLASGRAARPHNTPTHIHYQDSPRSFMRQNCARIKLLPASSEKPTRCPCGDETDDGRDSGEVGSRKYEWDPDVMRCDGCGTIAAARVSGCTPRDETCRPRCRRYFTGDNGTGIYGEQKNNRGRWGLRAESQCYAVQTKGNWRVGR
ncbi:hypothetical protein EDB85DRAFT_1030414 [Lactarius pseudohatsudake]|nr:hypothetical protein EDB85DRAFT_1030414 [Lactarius pseudohatsudake]